MPLVELVYVEGCPHVEAARSALRFALRTYGLPQAWLEWEASNENLPERVVGYASPTVLVDGVDVRGSPRGHGSGCALEGAPSAATIAAGLRGTTG